MHIYCTASSLPPFRTQKRTALLLATRCVPPFPFLNLVYRAREHLFDESAALLQFIDNADPLRADALALTALHAVGQIAAGTVIAALLGGGAAELLGGVIQAGFQKKSLKFI